MNTKVNLLDRVHAFTGRFIAYPNEYAKVAHTVWTAHTYLLDAFYTTPRLAIVSPDKKCGKSRLLTITSLLVKKPQMLVNPSPAALFTLIDKERPTLLLDEIDRTYEKKDTQDITAILNCGFQKGQKVPRVSLEHGREIEYFDTFAAILIAGIDNNRLPDTVLDRSIVIRMKRRTTEEKVEPYRPQDNDSDGLSLSEKLEEWSQLVLDKAKSMRVELPPGIQDRDADKWEPLLITARLMDQYITGVTAVTVTAGCGYWEGKVRLAALAYLKEEQEMEPASTGELLLKDIYNIFCIVNTLGDKTYRIRSTDLIDKLTSLPESPWSNYSYGRSLDGRGLSRLLKPYRISSKTVRLEEDKTAKGYFEADFIDAWKRHIPAIYQEATPPGYRN